ncbi:hypothetical protein KAH27_03735 [bacterium]|nr:hypothetical protein [bacterium]
MKTTIYFLAVVLSVMLIHSADAAVKNTRTSIIYEKIYLAVWAAESGDTLLVAKGIYTNDWIPLDHKSLSIKGNYADDFSVQFETDTIKTIIEAGQNYAAWAASCTSYFEYIRLTAGEHGLIAVDSLVTCKNCFVEFNTNSTHGAGILAYNDSTIVLDYSHIRDNIVTGAGGKGGGVYISNNCSLALIAHANFLRNEAENGGAVYLNNADFDMGYHASIYGCKAEKNGGGIYMLDSVLNMHQGCNIGASGVNVTNMATGDGGGIYALNSSISFDDLNAATLDNIAGRNGGSVYISNCTFIANNRAGIGYTTTRTGVGRAGNRGGGMYAIDSTVIFTNKATLLAGDAVSHGGGLYEKNCDVYFYSSTVGSTNPALANYSGNKGGGIYASGGKVLIDNTEFINNSANSAGGGIRVYSGAECNINNSIFRNNSSGYSGGALALDNQCTVTVYNSDILYNTADNDGGGIYAYRGFLYMENCNLNNNTADNDISTAGNGGALCVNNAKAEIVAGGFINYMLTNSAINGGAIFVDYNGTLVCSATNNYLHVLFNSVSKNGGGICVQDNSEVIITGGVVFANNGASKNGGGGYISDNSTLKMVDSGYNYIPGFYQNGALNNGGGLALSNAAEFTGINCWVSKNVAWNNGGGIYANASTVSITASYVLPRSVPPCKMDNNFALKNGGAFFGTSGSYFELDGAEITNNIALVYAGGIESYGSSMDIYNTIIAGNKSPDCGGIASLKNGRVGLYFCTIANNLTNTFDTGSLLLKGSLTLTNCIVWDNIGDDFSGSGTKNIGYSDIEGGFTGEGNINVNPDFDVNYTLMASSPCIDTGVFIGVTYDCIGETRPYGDKVDMGAYEFIPEPGGVFLFGIFILFLKKLN